MADDEGEPAAVWAVDDRDAEVPRLPWFHRHPRVQLAVVQPLGALPPALLSDSLGALRAYARAAAAAV